MGTHDRDEFERFYRATQPKLLKFLIFKGACPADAADASQHAWEQVYRRWDRVSHMEFPYGYLRTTAWNALKDLKSRPRHHDDEAAEERWIDLSAVDAACAKEEVSSVLRSLNALPERQRTVIALLYDGFSPQQIAEDLRMNPSTVRSTIRHARCNLKRNLGLEEEG